MEKMAIFALLDQFLDWIDMQVLIGFDFDLVLTKYYKETLESPLKNKKIHKPANNSSTDFTQREILTDWKFIENISARRTTQYTYSTPSFSYISLLPLFLSLILASS